MKAMRILGSVLLLTATLWSGAAQAGADTLVVKTADGYGPGAATSWAEKGTTVTFTLAGDADGNAIAAFLSDRLANAKVSFADVTLTVSGIPANALLEQLAGLSLTGGGDPLADLGGLGGAVIAMDAPEGGGSIRASKPTSVSTRPSMDPKERLEAEVLDVKRGSFPQVTLRLKIRRSAKAGPLKMKLRKNMVVDVPVSYAVSDVGLDLRLASNQGNLVAYYLEKGDRIIIHAVAGSDTPFAVDWVARKGKK